MRERGPAGACMGRLFLKYAPLLRLYAQYASNHDRALSVVTDMGKREAFQQMAEACAASEECKHKVRVG